MASVFSGKNKIRTMQCCNYSRGSCTTSHSVTIPKLETAFIQGMEELIATKQFTIIPPPKPRTEMPTIDYDKLISVEERRLERAKDAYLNEIDTIEQYKQNKEEITARIDDLKARRDKETFKEVDINAFTKKVVGIVNYCKRADVPESAKNEALHTIINKVVFDKAQGNLAIYFHEI